MIRATGVTPVPVDTLPTDILAAFDSSFNGPIDILSISFKRGTTLEQKAAAIASINGRVVGGWGVRSSEYRFYMVRFPSSGDEDLLAAQGKLHENPAVIAALPMIFGTAADVDHPMEYANRPHLEVRR